MARTSSRYRMWVGAALLPVSAWVGAQPASSAGAGCPGIEAKAMSTLQRMAQFLARAPRFSVTADMGYDVVQDWGQKIELGEVRKIVVRRPDHARIDASARDGDVSRMYYDGKVITAFDAKDNVYATATRPGTLDDAISFFTKDLNMRLPLAQLLSSQLPRLIAQRVLAVYHVEQATIAGVVTEHVAARGDEVDLQVWVAKGEAPLLQRIVITYKHEDGRPQFWAHFTDWNLSPEVPDALFDFTPPQGAARIAFSPQADLHPGTSRGEE